MKKTLRRVFVLMVVTLMLVSLLPIATSSAITTVQGTNIISQGQTILKGTWHFNCETGAVTTNGDIWWRQINTISRQIEPVSPAQIINLGKVDFNALTATKLDDFAYSSLPIIGNNNATNQLVNGDVFAVRTKLGNYAKIQVVSYGYNMTIRWVTYRKPLATPMLVSPINGQAMLHYPRTTTLAWRPVVGATYYVVERAFHSGSTWTAYPVVTVTGNYNTTYTFNFVGDQQGRWRVTAYGPNTLSSPSAWWIFSYSTAPVLATPILVSPVANINFYNFPRITTLTWKPSPGATSYLVEVQYYDTDWRAYKSATVTGVLAASYTFTFVGSQPGRWRVTAIASAPYRNSAPSAWRVFYYKI